LFLLFVFVVCFCLSSHTLQIGQEAAQLLSQSTNNHNIHFYALDLSSSQQIRSFVQQFVDAKYPPVTHLLLNAGLQVPHGLTYSEDGIETTFAVNHLGHFLLFQLFKPHLTPNARVTVTASGTHDPLQNTRTPPPIYHTAEELAHPIKNDQSDTMTEGVRRYTTSKLCNVLFTYELARRLHEAGSGIHVNAFDPGYEHSLLICLAG
jgi:NAD(P)-dependent dehydrogenase (short-subunit alcohol dehydrogenase family)